MRYLALLVLVLSWCTNSLACVTDDSVFSRYWVGNPRTSVSDYNDLGRVHVDAEDPACAERAKDRLMEKLQSALAKTATPKPFTDIREGYHVALIFAAASRLGANGWATKDLDALLSGPAVPNVKSQYVFTKDSDCADVNTCMDEYAGAAAAFAWIAAYEYRRGRDASTYRSLAKQHLSATLSSVCIHDATVFSINKTILCNGTPADLADGSAVTLSMNHAPDANQGPQQIPYGFGLMPNVASAIIGLETSGNGPVFTVDERRIAKALFDEARAHVSSNSFLSNCLWAERVSQYPLWTLTPGQPCGGPFQYQATMFRLDKLYQTYFGYAPSTGYLSNTFSSSNFALYPTANSFFSYGRYVGFYTHGYRWLSSRPEFIPFDRSDPIGFLEGINTNGIAGGWT